MSIQIVVVRAAHSLCKHCPSPTPPLASSLFGLSSLSSKASSHLHPPQAVSSHIKLFYSLSSLFLARHLLIYFLCCFQSDKTFLFSLFSHPSRDKYIFSSKSYAVSSHTQLFDSLSFLILAMHLASKYFLSCFSHTHLSLYSFQSFICLSAVASQMFFSLFWLNLFHLPLSDLYESAPQPFLFAPSFLLTVSNTFLFSTHACF